jgi:hypothetical protein
MLLTFEPADDGSQDVEAAMELVSATAWDGPMDCVREARAQVFACLGLAAPVVTAQPAPAQQGNGVAPSADENASYAALLSHTLRGM